MPVKHTAAHTQEGAPSFFPVTTKASARLHTHQSANATRGKNPQAGYDWARRPKHSFHQQHDVDTMPHPICSTKIRRPEKQMTKALTWSTACEMQMRPLNYHRADEIEKHRKAILLPRRFMLSARANNSSNCAKASSAAMHDCSWTDCPCRNQAGKSSHVIWKLNQRTVHLSGYVPASSHHPPRPACSAVA